MSRAPASRLRVESVHPDDPRAAPLLHDLTLEYDTRYEDLFGGAATELSRYPAAEFQPPDGEFLLVLGADGHAVAGGAYRRYRHPGTAEVKRMWTSSAHRRQGLGRLVLTELEQRARAAGYTRMHLTTGARQPEARDLYLAAGWTPLFDPATPLPTDLAVLRALPVPDRLYAFERSLLSPPS